MPTYYCTNTASDLGGGADFSNKLLTTTSGAANISVPIAVSATETSYFFTEANVPFNADWETGTITVEVNVTTSNSNVQLKLSAARINSTGTVQSTSTETAFQAFTSTGVLNYTVPSMNWTEGSRTDRLRLNFIFNNLSGSMAQTAGIGVNTTNEEVVTVVTQSPTKASRRIIN